jgi:hypothetical protein
MSAIFSEPERQRGFLAGSSLALGLGREIPKACAGVTFAANWILPAHAFGVAAKRDTLLP